MHKAIWAYPVPKAPRHQALHRIVQHVYIQRLMDLASHEAADPQVRAEATSQLNGFASSLGSPGNKLRSRDERASRWRSAQTSRVS